MSLYMKIAAITALLMFSAIGSGGNFKAARPSKGGEKGTVKAYNKSPCLEEDVYACQAEGGTFNWRHCTCERW